MRQIPIGHVLTTHKPIKYYLTSDTCINPASLRTDASFRALLSCATGPLKENTQQMNVASNENFKACRTSCCNRLTN